METVTIIAFILLVLNVIQSIALIKANNREYEYICVIEELTKKNAILKAKLDVLKLSNDSSYEVEIDKELEELIKQLCKEEE